MDYVTEDYAISVGQNKEDQTVYLITNKETGVVEYEDYLLPRTLNTLVELQSRLEEARETFDKPVKPLAIVGDIDGERTH